MSEYQLFLAFDRGDYINLKELIIFVVIRFLGLLIEITLKVSIII